MAEIRRTIETDDVYMPSYMADFDMNDWVFYSKECWHLTFRSLKRVDVMRREVWNFSKGVELDPLEQLRTIRTLCPSPDTCVRPDHLKLSVPQALQRRRAAEAIAARDAAIAAEEDAEDDARTWEIIVNGARVVAQRTAERTGRPFEEVLEEILEKKREDIAAYKANLQG